MRDVTEAYVSCENTVRRRLATPLPSEIRMPFGLGAGEAIVVLVGMLVVWLLPLGAAVWALVTLSRLRNGQQELLAKMASLERRLGERS